LNLFLSKKKTTYFDDLMQSKNICCHNLFIIYFLQCKDWKGFRDSITLFMPRQSI